MLQVIADWFDSRTGFRAARKHLLDEPLPAGTGWWFVTGSIVLFLISIQFVTGVVLTMYYVPAPDHAYDSVRFIMDRLPFGGVLRGCTSSAPASSSSRRSSTCSRRRARLLPQAARDDLDHRRGAAAADSRLRAERLPAAVGSEGVLGDDRHHQRRRSGPMGEYVAGCCAAAAVSARSRCCAGTRRTCSCCRRA
jgi:hypothetical protein